MTARRLFQRDPGGGVTALFDDRRVFWSFNTRVAIRTACDIVGLKAGDEVLAPGYNCGSELDPLVHAGLTVRLYPVAEDLRADPTRIEPLISERTRAIYVTHYFGMIQPDLEGLRGLCDRHGLRLIEDCALSLLSGAAPAEGYTGDVSVFCFHKFVPVLEGGALLVNASDLEVAEAFPHDAPRGTVAKKLARAALANLLGPHRAQSMMRIIRGRQSAAISFTSPGMLEDIPGHYYFDPALQGRRISAFAALPLRSFPVSEMITARRENWFLYRDMLDGIPGVRMLMPELLPETCPLNMPVILANRDHVARAMQARGIGVTPWWAGYNCNLDWTGQKEAMALKNNVLSLPLHPYLTRAHLEHIITQLRQVL